MEKHKNLKSYFYTGLLSTLPIILTIYIFNMVFQFIFSLVSDSFLSAVLHDILGKRSNGLLGTKTLSNIFINLLSIIISFTLITIVGYTLNHVFFCKIVEKLKKLLERAPVVKYIYTTVSQLVSLVTSDKALTYQKVVTAEYPRKGIYSIGFITAERNFIMETAMGEEVMCNVFFPTSPNPTSGMFVVIPQRDVTVLDIKVDDAVKLIISGGAIVPKADFTAEEEKMF
ncbi:MAG: DUF502 domain-containing protein [Fusobacteriaceae bacterium]|nr:DUF502 domain-containing protein [Fusobacteriaceae bacterium]